MYSFYQKDVSTSRNSLDQEMTTLDIMENELNEAKRRMNIIQDQKLNKMRMVEINTYYGKRYNAHSKLMKIIVIICVPLLILAILAHRGILPPKIYMLIVGIILIIGVIMIGRQLIDMTNRSNMNWDEYNWYFNKKDAPSSSSTTSNPTNPWAVPSMTCIGAECCYEGSTYDSTTNICVPNSLSTTGTTTTDTTTTTTTPTTDTTATTTTEGFKELGRYAYTQVKPTPINNMVMPSFSSLAKF
jgi:hypothetical protein